MTDEIDWPMTVGTLALAAFLGWVVLAMFRPPVQARTPGAMLRAAQVAQDVSAPAKPLPPGQPSRLRR